MPRNLELPRLGTDAENNRLQWACSIIRQAYLNKVRWWCSIKCVKFDKYELVAPYDKSTKKSRRRRSNQEVVVRTEPATDVDFTFDDEDAYEWQMQRVKDEKRSDHDYCAWHKIYQQCNELGVNPLHVIRCAFRDGMNLRLPPVPLDLVKTQAISFYRTRSEAYATQQAVVAQASVDKLSGDLSTLRVKWQTKNMEVMIKRIAESGELDPVVESVWRLRHNLSLPQELVEASIVAFAAAPAIYSQVSAPVRRRLRLRKYFKECYQDGHVTSVALASWCGAQ